MRPRPAVNCAFALLLCTALLAARFCVSARADSQPTLVLYPATLNSADDVHALVDLRKELRKDAKVEVLTYDPESAAMVRAASDAHLSQILASPMTSDQDRAAMTRALGAQFFAVVSKSSKRGKLSVSLTEAGPSARSWTAVDQKAEDAAHQIESDMFAPAPAAPPAVPTPLPVPPAPLPAPVAPTPAPVAPVAAAPAPAPQPPAVIKQNPPVNAPPPAIPEVAPKPPAPAAPAALPVAQAAKPTPVAKAAPASDGLAAIKGQLSQGDSLLSQGDFAGAIAVFRSAINLAPFSAVPRLRLAETYLQADMKDKALDEATRALEIDPGNTAILNFLSQLDAQTGSSEGSIARYTAQVAQNAKDPMAHIELGDAYWNSNSINQAESEYKTALSLAATGSEAQHTASAHLARLYAAEQRYADSLAALKSAGPGGYALALGIIQSRTDTLSTTLDGAHDDFTAGKTTHAAFYKTAGDVSAQAQELANFVIKVTPPPAFKLSHLYRIQATHLLAQQAAVLVNYIETSDSDQAARAAQLGKEAQTEMLIAHATEQKLGLWGGKQAEAKK